MPWISVSDLKQSPIEHLHELRVGTGYNFPAGSHFLQASLKPVLGQSLR